MRYFYSQETTCYCWITSSKEPTKRENTFHSKGASPPFIFIQKHSRVKGIDSKMKNNNNNINNNNNNKKKNYTKDDDNNNIV